MMMLMMMVDGIDGVRMEGDEEIKYYWKRVDHILRHRKREISLCGDSRLALRI